MTAPTHYDGPYSLRAEAALEQIDDRQVVDAFLAHVDESNDSIEHYPPNKARSWLMARLDLNDSIEHKFRIVIDIRGWLPFIMSRINMKRYHPVQILKTRIKRLCNLLKRGGAEIIAISRPKIHDASSYESWEQKQIRIAESYSPDSIYFKQQILAELLTYHGAKLLYAETEDDVLEFSQEYGTSLFTCSKRAPLVCDRLFSVMNGVVIREGQTVDGRSRTFKKFIFAPTGGDATIKLSGTRPQLESVDDIDLTLGGMYGSDLMFGSMSALEDPIPLEFLATQKLWSYFIKRKGLSDMTFAIVGRSGDEFSIRSVTIKSVAIPSILSRRINANQAKSMADDLLAKIIRKFRVNKHLTAWLIDALISGITGVRLSSMIIRRCNELSELDSVIEDDEDEF